MVISFIGCSVTMVRCTNQQTVKVLNKLVEWRSEMINVGNNNVSKHILNIILLGRTNCAKGTQGKILEKRIKIPVSRIVMSDELKNTSDVEVIKMMNASQNVPCEKTYRVWASAYNREREKIFKKIDKHGVIIHDGIFRMARQTEMMLGRMISYGDEVIAIDLNVPEEICLERGIKRAKKLGRPDDNLEGLRNRLKIYAENRDDVEKIIYSAGIETRFIKDRGNLSVEEVNSMFISLLPELSGYISDKVPNYDALVHS